MTEGLIRNMPEHEYRAHPAVANSDLKNIDRSPAYAQWKRANVDTGSKATTFGTALHAAVLEPEKFAGLYVEDPQSPKGGYPAGWRNTKDYKAQAAHIDGLGKRRLPADELQAVNEIAGNVQRHEIGQVLEAVKDGTEFSVFAQHETHPLMLKSRPDLLASSAKMIVDLKSTRARTQREFARDCVTFGYHRGAAHYLDQMARIDEDYEHYVFLTCCSEPPYEVNAYVLDEDSIEQGRHEIAKAIDKWVACVERDAWPAGSGDIQELRIPQYAINYHLEEED